MVGMLDEKRPIQSWKVKEQQTVEIRFRIDKCARYPGGSCAGSRWGIGE
jgi:hypothetical protein